MSKIYVLWFAILVYSWFFFKKGGWVGCCSFHKTLCLTLPFLMLFFGRLTNQSTSDWSQCGTNKSKPLYLAVLSIDFFQSEIMILFFNDCLFLWSCISGTCLRICNCGPCSIYHIFIFSIYAINFLYHYLILG